MVLRISEMAHSEQPRNRLTFLGPTALTNAELLSIIIGSDVNGENAIHVSQRILQYFHGWGGLHRAPITALQEQHGIGNTKAAQIKAAIDIGRRLSLESPEERPTINSPADAAALVSYEMAGLDQEVLRIIQLDRRNQVMEITEVYKGSVNSSQVRIAEVFKHAIRINASAIVVVHNHPSGDPTPSPDDVAVTRQIVQAGKLLDIEVLDHMIIGVGKWVSLKERGLGFA